jgi:DNA primase
LREHGYALVTEGYMDVVALAQMGFANAVATLGTACTAEHVQKLFRFTDSVVFSFDGDSAGRRAARKALDAALPFATDVRIVKFLFLPAEHDPDSYIREHGKDGFADYVAKALPLSKFMLQAAAEDCDLGSAEGRAHMASNARPLWTQLPDGALKRQLLAEIADKVLIDVRDLLELWQPASKAGGYKKNSYLRSDSLARSPKSSSKSAQNSDVEAFSGYPDDGGYPGSYEVDDLSSEPNFSAPVAATVKVTRRVAGRLLPASREDRVLRLLLTEPQSWDLLDSEEHHLLCTLPPPHGPLFAWAESQLHEHGPQPWAALREGLRGHAHEAHAIAQISQIPEGIEGDWSEVRSIVDQLVKLRRQQEMQELAGRAATDPLALQRYKELASSLQK